MRKKSIVVTSVMLASALMLTALGGCGKKDSDADNSATIFEPIGSGESKDGAESGNGSESGNADIKITDEMALNAVKNYCYRSNPDLEGIEEAGEYPVYWEIESKSDSQIVVLFRSYTGAEIRYYVDSTSGETYVTEFVQGITDKEQRTDETFNVKDQIQ